MGGLCERRGKFCWCCFLCADIIKWQQWKRFIKNYYRSTLQWWWLHEDLSIFCTPPYTTTMMMMICSLPLSPSHTTTIQQCERCGTNDDSNFFKLYKARHTILHCICHAETLTSDARYILYVENWKLVTEIHLVNGTCSNSRRSGSGSSNREMQVGR